MAKKTHGYMCKNQPEWVKKLYNNYQKIKNRCYDISDKSYPRYGGKGRKMCSGWLNSIGSFIKDVGQKPNQNLSIDRKDNSLHYSCGHCEECLKMGWPMNVRWATQKEQQSNRSDNYWIEYRGDKFILTHLCVKFSIRRMQVKYWLKKGWSIEDTVDFLTGVKRYGLPRQRKKRSNDIKMLQLK